MARTFRLSHARSSTGFEVRARARERGRARGREREREREGGRNLRRGAVDVPGMDRQPLDFERLDVYRCAIEFLALCVRLAARMPWGHADLRDQLRRAATSIPLNIAEASGKTSGPDRA